MRVSMIASLWATSMRCGIKGHARDYACSMMLQQGTPEDFVIATGRQESVRHFIELSASPGLGENCDGRVMDQRKLDAAPIQMLL